VSEFFGCLVMLLGCLGRLLVTVNFAMTPAPPTTTSPNASGDGENESGASGTAMGEPGLQPVVLGMVQPAPGGQRWTL
jgi:hypothetical protein